MFHLVFRQLADRGGQFHPTEGNERRGHHLRVELAAGQRLQLAQGLVHRFARLVDAVGGHGVEAVGHHQDAGEQGDARAAQPVRVAHAVIALVVVADDRGQFPVHGDAGEHGVAGPGVLLDEFVVERGEPAGLEQHRVRGGDLADVVEDGRLLEQVDLRSGQPQAFGEQPAVARHPHGVAGGVGVALVDHVGKREDGLLEVLPPLPLQAVHLFALAQGVDREADVAGQFLEHGDLLRLEPLPAHRTDAQYPERGGVAGGAQRQGDGRPEAEGVGPVEPGGDADLRVPLDEHHGGVVAQAAGRGRSRKRVSRVGERVRRRIGQADGRVRGVHSLDLVVLAQTDPAEPVVTVFAHHPAGLDQERVQLRRGE